MAKGHRDSSRDYMVESILIRCSFAVMGFHFCFHFVFDYTKLPFRRLSNPDYYFRLHFDYRVSSLFPFPFCTLITGFRLLLPYVYNVFRLQYVFRFLLCN